LEEDIRSKLDCPICFEVMTPPIKQCREGHPFCNACCDTLCRAPLGAKCPTCRTPLTPPVARALQLEQVASGLRLKCKWDSCDQVCAYGDYARHLETCTRRPVDCPFSGATCWCGTVGDLRNHLGEKHKVKAVNTQHVGGTRTFTVTWGMVIKEGNLFARGRKTRSVKVKPVQGITPGCVFAFSFWCPGPQSPFLFAVQRVGRDNAGQSPQWTCSVQLKSAEETLTWTTKVPDLEASSDVFCQAKRQLRDCEGKVLVVSQKQIESLAVPTSREASGNLVIKLSFTFEKVVDVVNVDEQAAAAPSGA